MIKKLVVPALMLAMATFGCSSSTTPSTGTGGTSGGGHAGTVATGGTNAAGTSGGGTSGGGTSGGGTSGGGTSGGGHPGGGTSGGGTSGGGHAGGGTSGGGTSGGGTSGGGTSGGGTSGGGHGGGTVLMSSCTVGTQDHTTVLSAADFCTNLLANCGTTGTGYTDMTTCMNTYSLNTVNRRNCQSYHLCWGVEGFNSGPGLATPHCSHAEGAAPCDSTLQ